MPDNSVKYFMNNAFISYPIPVPMIKDIRLVITRVYITSFEKRDFLFILPFCLLNLDESEILRLLHVFVDNFHSLMVKKNNNN